MLLRLPLAIVIEIYRYFPLNSTANELARLLPVSKKAKELSESVMEILQAVISREIECCIKAARLFSPPLEDSLSRMRSEKEPFQKIKILRSAIGEVQIPLFSEMGKEKEEKKAVQAKMKLLLFANATFFLNRAEELSKSNSFVEILMEQKAKIPFSTWLRQIKSRKKRELDLVFAPCYQKEYFAKLNEEMFAQLQVTLLSCSNQQLDDIYLACRALFYLRSPRGATLLFGAHDRFVLWLLSKEGLHPLLEEQDRRGNNFSYYLILNGRIDMILHLEKGGFGKLFRSFASKSQEEQLKWFAQITRHFGGIFYWTFENLQLNPLAISSKRGDRIVYYAYLNENYQLLEYLAEHYSSLFLEKNQEGMPALLAALSERKGERVNFQIRLLKWHYLHENPLFNFHLYQVGEEGETILDLAEEPVKRWILSQEGLKEHFSKEDPLLTLAYVAEGV